MAVVCDWVMVGTRPWCWWLTAMWCVGVVQDGAKTRIELLENRSKAHLDALQDMAHLRVRNKERDREGRGAHTGGL